MKSALILVVEDDSAIAEDLQDRLKRMGHDTLVAHTGEDAVRYAGEITPDLLLVDIDLQGNIDAVDTAAYISNRWNIPLIYLTDYSDATNLEGAKATSPLAYLTKPLKDRELQTNIGMALHRHRIGTLLEANAEKYKAIFENARDVIYCLDEQGIIVDVSNAIENTLGYRKAEVLGKHFADTQSIVPEMREQLIGLYGKILSSELNQPVYSEAIHKDGHRILVEADHDPITLENGKRGILVITRDITKHEEIEQAIREKNHLLHAQNEQLRAIEEDLKSRIDEIAEAKSYSEGLLGSMTDGLCVVDLKGTLIDVNDAYLKLLGFSKREDVVGLQALQVLSVVADPAEVEKASASLQKCFAGLQMSYHEMAFTPMGSDPVVTSNSSNVVRDATGAPRLIFGVMRDITEKKRVEMLADMQLRLSQALSATNKLDEGLRLSLDTVLKVSEMDSGGIYLVDESSGGLRLECHCGLSADFISSVSYHEPNSPSTLLVMDAMPLYTNYMNLGIPLDDVRKREGLQASAILPVVHNHRVIACINVASHSKNEVPALVRNALEQIASQIGESISRLKAQDALYESEERYRRLAENATDVIWTMDMNLRFTYNSPSVTRIYGYSVEESMAHSLKDIFTPESRGMVTNLFQSELQLELNEPEEVLRSIQFEAEQYRKDGSTIWTHSHARFLRGSDGKPAGIIGVTRDITERKRLENALRQSDELYRALADNSLLGIAVMDAEYKIITVNATFASLFQKPADDFTGKYCFNEFEKRSAICSHCPGARAMASGRTAEVETQGIRDDGSCFYARNRAVPVFGPDGTVSGFIEIVEDIDKQKRAEIALRESEEKFRALAEYSPDTIVRVDRNYRLLYTNAAQANWTGIPQDEWIGKTSRELGLSEEMCQLGENAIDEVFLTGKAKRLEFSFPDGRCFDSILRPELDTEGNVKAIICSSRDISAQKQIENELRQSRETYRVAAEAFPDAIGIMDLQGTLTYVSQQAISMFGYQNAEEMMGRSFADFVATTESQEEMALRFQKTLAEGISKDVAFTLAKKDGTRFAASISAAVIRDASGTPTRIIGFTKDITDRKRAELEEARAKALEELDRMKTALLASVSHELRTPLTSIKGLASTLVQPDVTWDLQTQHEFLYEIDQAANRLTYIVSDLIDMSQLEAGTMRMENVPGKISTILNQINRQLTTASQKHKFEIEAASDLPMINCDTVRIGQVITNLVSNAASYSDEGTTITLEARHVGENIEISVTDQGIGISNNELERVFDRFYRLETGVTRRRGGSGLGLSICKGIIERHGGKIWAESQEGKGSQFTFTLPISKMSEP
ncbi:MAG: PAS domain S-box protein [Dehalococcoidia bacterium]|nr:PAS domain S-box protein [Dehalococcoidia bacterium]